ncbi:MAG: hypothetical protein RJB26_1138 [Pseudomonadota bacterium]
MRAHLTLRPFQRTGAAFLASLEKAAIYDSMGLGKTPQAIEGLRQLNLPSTARILVVAPLATALGWQREIRRWWPDCPHAFTICRRKDAVPAQGISFLAWTDLAERLPHLLDGDAPSFDLVIADEAHRIKGGAAVKLAKSFTGAWRKSGREWVRERGLVDRAIRTWMLTGTPIPNSRPIELLPALTLLGAVGDTRRGAVISRRGYEQKFCQQENRWTPSGFDLMARRNIDDLADLLRSTGRILRRTRADVRGELPDLTRTIVPLGGVKESKGVSDEAREALSRGELPPFEEMAAYRRDLGAAKAPAAAAWIASWLEEAGPDSAIVVFVHHKEAGRTIQERLMAEDAGLGQIEFASGDDPAPERQAKVDRFAQPGGPRVFIGTIDACGTGMNGLHLRTTVCCFAECAWTPAQLDQAEGRICRMGGKGGADAQAIAYYLGAADCLDIHIIETVDLKRDVAWRTLDADEGVRHSDTDAPPAPPTPAQQAEAKAQALGADDLPEPTDPSVRWSWAKDKNTGEWLLRNCHWLDDSAKAAWAGAEVTVTNASGKQTMRKLVECRYTGPHNGGWCIWTHAEPESPGGKHKVENARFIARMKRRARDAELLASLDTGGPLDDAMRHQAEACAAAARFLTACDADHASKRNDEGWSQADVTVGRIIAGIDTAFWTQATLAGAKAILRRYRNTQISALLGAAIWPS